MQTDGHSVQETLHALVREFDQLVPGEGAVPSCEPVLLQTLMILADVLPTELQPPVHHLIGIARLARSYGSYTRQETELVGEQIATLHEHQAAAERGLKRVEAEGVSGRIAPIRVTRSALPAGHPMRQVHEEIHWGVLISSEVNRKALLARLYPSITSRTSLGATIASYDRAHQPSHQ